MDNRQDKYYHYLAKPSKPERLVLPGGTAIPLVRVPAGEFLMGSANGDADAWDDEKPQHQVYLDEYLIGKTPVTVAQWRPFVQATGYRGDSHALRTDKDNHPVTLVTWDDAQAFCAWASQVTGYRVRLPTEAEWEKAARGTDGRIYPWGNQTDLDKRCNYGLSVGDTTPVGRYSPQGDSPCGCADMVGNVWEWVADWYGEHYYERSPRENPPGLASGEARVLRGGAFSCDGRLVRCASRYWGVPVFRFDGFGLRVVVAITE